MFKIILAFLIFFFVAWRNAKRKNSWLTSSSFLICLYTLSVGMTIVDIPMNHDTLVLKNSYWGASMYMTVMILAFLFPILHFDESKVNAIKLPNRQILDIFSDVIIVLSIFSIFYYLPIVSNLLRGDLGALRNALYAGEEYVEAGLWNTVASTSSSLYVFALLLFFIYLCIGASKWRLVLLFVSSLSNIVHVLAYVGRDGVVFWIFAFFYLYLLFKPYLNTGIRKGLKKTALIAGGVMLIPFMLISIGRFQDDGGVLNSIVSYFGQPFVYGTLYFGIDNPPVDPGHGFPLFYELTGLHMPEGIGRWEMGGTVSWVFGTFLKSLYASLGGSMGLIIFCIVFGMIFMLVFGKKQRMLHFSKLFVYILYFEVLSQGVFYFRQYTRGGNLFILLCFMMAIVFNVLQKSEKPIVIERQGGG